MKGEFGMRNAELLRNVEVVQNAGRTAECGTGNHSAFGNSSAFCNPHSELIPHSALRIPNFYLVLHFATKNLSGLSDVFFSPWITFGSL